MGKTIELATFGDDRGYLTVAQDKIPFDIKRVYYIYGAKGKRGGHRHKSTTQALICLNGSCEIYMNNRGEESTVLLDSPSKCLILDKDDWHTMDKFSEGSILLVFASTKYDVEDYIDEPY
ncbi:MAG: FdtA/QdtA family cupin domain-containing protein [Flavobacteriales bacterium]|nr:FdtA/QdtA family cupin domain-containing protein [Flavobacteriales bacterium]